MIYAGWGWPLCVRCRWGRWTAALRSQRRGKVIAMAELCLKYTAGTFFISFVVSSTSVPCATIKP